MKENGFGFFHSIVNQTGEWVLLGLEKQLLDLRKPDFEPKLAVLDEKEREKAKSLIECMAWLGTESFDVIPETVDAVIPFEPKKSLPFLIEALNLRDNGRHNPCTAFCVILKISKKHPEVVLSYLKEALEKKTAPSYYLKDLLQKIEKMG